jgi:hypothetical protein
MERETKRDRRARFELETLEDRRLMSAESGPGIKNVPRAVVPAAMVKGSTYLSLDGSGRGTFSQHRPLPDVGVADVFNGRARLSRLGVVKVTGSLSGTGFILQGHATGRLTLRNARGSVTLALTGPPEGGFQAPASGTHALAVAVKSGTGAYARAIGTGRVDLGLGSDNLKITFHGDPNRF